VSKRAQHQQINNQRRQQEKGYSNQSSSTSAPPTNPESEELLLELRHGRLKHLSSHSPVITQPKSKSLA
jgi:hypothetical protein